MPSGATSSTLDGVSRCLGRDESLGEAITSRSGARWWGPSRDARWGSSWKEEGACS